MRRDIEERSLNAWPALETQVFDGWLLRFARGHTKRSNSVNPLYSSVLAPERKIGVVEQIYRDRGLPCVFKLSAWSEPADLDQRLAARGYRLVDPTSIRLTEIGGASRTDDPELNLSALPPPAWLADIAELAALDGAKQAALSDMLHRVPQPAVFGAISHGGRTIAAGMGVLENAAVGLFEIITHPHHRRQGLARRICAGILGWAAARGARESYLQVVANNEPAIRLYDELGFREIYRYHYRVKD